MRQCYEQPEEAWALGVIGQAEAKEKLSLKAAGQRMAEQLAKVPGFGERQQSVAAESLTHLTR
jgi:hypothetical protein